MSVLLQSSTSLEIVGWFVGVGFVCLFVFPPEKHCSISLCYFEEELVFYSCLRTTLQLPNSSDSVAIQRGKSWKEA